MAVSVREHLEDQTVSSSSITLTTGAGTQVGDVLLLLHLTSFYAASAMLTPSGGGTWQGPIVVARDDATNAPHIKAWWREVTSGGAQTVTTNHSNTDPPQHAHLLVLAGADTASPISGSGVLDDGFGTSQVAPSVTGAADGLLMCGWVSDDVVTYTAPGGMTGFQTSTAFSAAMGAYELLASGGATGTRTATTSAAKTHSAVAIAVAAAVTGGPAAAGYQSTSLHPGAGPSRFARFIQRPGAFPTDAASVAQDDSGTSAETLAVTAEALLADTGSTAEAIAADVTATLADSASSAEAVAPSVAVPLADTAAGADAISVDTGATSKALADSGSGTDSLGGDAAAALSDTASAGDVQFVAAALGLADAAMSADTLTLAVTVALAEAGTAVEAVAVSATLSLTDGGAGADDADGAQEGAKTLTETAAGVDRLRVLIVRPDTGTVTRPNSGIIVRPDTGTVERP